MAKGLQENQSITTVCGVNYQLLSVSVLKSSDGQLLVAVDPSQLRTMAPETLDLIHWPVPYTLYSSVPL